MTNDESPAQSPQVISAGEYSDSTMVAASLTTLAPVLAIRNGTKAALHPASDEPNNHREFWLTNCIQVFSADDNAADQYIGTTGCQFAVMTGQESRGDGLALVGLDLDGKREVLDALLEEAGPEAIEWAEHTVKSQRCPERLHLFGLAKVGEIPRTCPHLAAGLEWRGTTGYMLLPGALHPSGQRYEITGGEVIKTDGPSPNDRVIFDGYELNENDRPIALRWREVLVIPDCLMNVIRGRVPDRDPDPEREQPSGWREYLAGRSNDSIAPIARPDGPGQARSTPGGAGAPDDAALSKRLAGLVRVVADAESGRGNKTLNWAARLSGALLRAAPVETQRAAKKNLTEAYLARPTDEPVSTRKREALATIKSGWTNGVANYAKVLANDVLITFDLSDGDDGAPTETEPALVAEATDDEIEAQFFNSRDWLGQLRDYAREHQVAPWAMLACVIAQAAAAIPPNYVLPPVIGGVASLNMFAALVGKSGGGKSSTMTAAKDFLHVHGGCEAFQTHPGTGEGLLELYCTRTKAQKNKPSELIPKHVSVLLRVDEIGSLDALVNRTAATLLPFLKTACHGGMLGTANAEQSRQRRVEAQKYRLAMIAGVQPSHAHVILADADGGFPQRWQWAPVDDPHRPEYDEVKEKLDKGLAALPYDWTVPGKPLPALSLDGIAVLTLDTTVQIRIPDEARKEIMRAAAQHNRPIDAPPLTGPGVLDGHALLTREKIAAVLAMLDGIDAEITAEWWTLAGLVMQISDRTRAKVIAVNAKTAAAEHDGKAKRAGRAQVLTEESANSTRVGIAVGKLLARLDAAPGGEMPYSTVRSAMSVSQRTIFDDVVDEAVRQGRVLREERNNASGKPTVYLRVPTK